MKAKLFISLSLLITLGSASSSAEDVSAGSLTGQAVLANDNLNAVLWAQTSVEAQANALGAYALARLRLDEALADKARTAAPAEQTGAFQDLPPAVILDVDDTALNTARYQAWTVKAGTNFAADTWTKYVNAKIDVPIPGALDFTKYAASKGVKVFYVTNRTKEEEPASVALMKEMGFPIDDAGEMFLSAKEQPDWSSAKSTRRAVIAKSHRILLLIGDNFGDFTDAYKGSLAERQKAFEDNRARWGREWIVIANPTYGSFESSPYKSDYKLPLTEQRRLKIEALDGWTGP